MSSPSPYLRAEPVTVEVALGDTIYVLTPSLPTLKAISRMTGQGIAGTFKALANFDVDAFVAVIVAGSGSSGKAAQEVEKQVYLHGLESLAKPLTRFCNVLMNGGRDPDAEAQADGAN